MMNYDFTVQSANPMQGINNALQTYGTVRNIQLQEEQAGLQRQEYAQQQEAAAAQKARAQRYQSRLAEISEDPSPKNILGLSVEFPEASEAHERVFKMADEERQRAATQTANNIFTAFNSGKPEIAQGLIQKHLEAAKNSGDKGNIDFYTMFSEIAEENPKQAQAIAGQMLTATKEGRESLKALDDSAKKRSETSINMHEASIKSDEAAVSRDTVALRVLEKKLSNAKTQKEIKNIQSQIDDRSAKSAASMKKLEEAKSQRQETVELAALDIDKLYDAVDRTLQLGQVGDGFGTVIEQATGGFQGAAWNPTFDSDVVDFEESIKQVESMIFIMKSPMMKGVVSDADAVRMERAEGSLKLTQNPKTLTKNLNIIKDTAGKYRRILENDMGPQLGLPVQM